MSRVRNAAYGVRRIFLLGMPIAVLLTVFLGGCVSGSAGYWNTGPDGQLKSKQAGFDTANLVQKDKTLGSVTI